MFKRKLQALDSQNVDKFNISDDNEFRNMILWLEDQKIRHYKIEDRGALRNIHSPEWEKSLDSENAYKSPKEDVYSIDLKPLQYLGELNCPYKGKDRCMTMDWLLGYAVRLEYGDDVEKYKKVTPESVQMSRTGSSGGASSNPLDSLNFDDPDFKAGVASLAVMLQVPPYNDHLEQLKAICLIVKEKFAKSNLEAAAKSDGKNDVVPLDKTELGFETGDYIMSEAAKILRLIHIHDLRDLQTQINAAIVAVQAVTANPKTDSRLGKVGR